MNLHITSPDTGHTYTVDTEQRGSEYVATVYEIAENNCHFLGCEDTYPDNESALVAGMAAVARTHEYNMTEM